jgi:VWFA-related protein
MKRAAALLLLSVTALAQAPPLVETMEVRVVNLDVVVTDRSGRRVTGLTRNDFEVLEGRKPQTITHFSEIDGGAALPPATTPAPAPDAPQAVPPPPARGATIVFYIDASSIDPKRRHMVFKELQDFVPRIMKPGDRATVMSWHRRLHTLQPFTRSAEEIQGALADGAKTTSGTSIYDTRRVLERRIQDELQMALESPSPPDVIRGRYTIAQEHAQQYAEEMYAHARTLLVSLTSTLAGFAAPEDKKALVFVGDFLPAQAGSEMLQFVEDVFEPQLRTLGAADIVKALRPRSLSTDTWRGRVVKAANTAGVTLYMISAGGLQQMSVNADGLEAPVSRMANDVFFADTRKTFERTAEETGGIAFTGGDARAALRQIEDDFRSYYSLGFRPTGAAGKSQRLTVRVKRPGYTVRTRQSYSVRSPVDEMADRVVANLYDDPAPGGLTVRLANDAPRAVDDDELGVPVKVFVQGRNVMLIPQGGRLAGELTVFVCAGDPEEGASKVLRHTERLSIPAEDEPRFRAGYLTFSFQVIVNPKRGSTISAGALDTVSGKFGVARWDVRQ